VVHARPDWWHGKSHVWWLGCDSARRQGSGDHPRSSNSAHAVPSGGLVRAYCSDHCRRLHCYGGGARERDPVRWPVQGLAQRRMQVFFFFLVFWLMVGGVSRDQVTDTVNINSQLQTFQSSLLIIFFIFGILNQNQTWHLGELFPNQSLHSVPIPVEPLMQLSTGRRS
jgi:hypothetical protein